MAQAVGYARDLDGSLWDFAVEIEHLLALGMTTHDLRWLVKRGYLSHAREITINQDTDRRFDPTEQNSALAQNTCFVLTEAGQAFFGVERSSANHGGIAMSVVADNLRSSFDDADLAADSQMDLPSGARSGPAAIPHWDGKTRTFSVGEHLIKRFRVPAPNQEAVLEAFQEEGWPTVIDDPLSPVLDCEPKRRLRDTIKRLNLNQVTRFIRFRADGTGEGVAWELLPNLVSRAESTCI